MAEFAINNASESVPDSPLTDRLEEGFEVGDSSESVPDSPGNSHISDTARSGSGKKVEGTENRFHPWAHVSRLKPRAKYPERPSGTIDIPEDDDFDAALLREDSWEPDGGSGEYEIEAILDVRWVIRTRTSRLQIGFPKDASIAGGCSTSLTKSSEPACVSRPCSLETSSQTKKSGIALGRGPEPTTLVDSGVSPRNLIPPDENTLQNMSEVHISWGVDPNLLH
ncbi:hypothetical protein PHMEG_00019473 [Phytophthora megakarya]|uniref:Uncharacterized protein n=1 Tax=Phytophthora megakarya TaxID=4795 RepID=A0A225VSA9_9STRA|nr:hypothetical protein PHMEG_00019473 [Phytophthora megakarya]